MSVLHLPVHASDLFSQCSDSCLICSGPLTISCRILRIKIACIDRERYQRYPASVTSVIQRIDTFTVVAEPLVLQPCFVGLCETASLSQLRGTLSIIDRRRSDGGIGVCTPSEIQYGRGRWLWRPQTHTYLERKRCQVGIIP